MARILVLSLSDVGSDPRVDRQVEALAARHEVVVAAFGAPATPGAGFVELDPALPRPLGFRTLYWRAGVAATTILRRWDRLYWLNPAYRRWRDQLGNVRADLLVVNDVYGLPLGLSVARGRPVVFDAHEYFESWYSTTLRGRLTYAPYVRHLSRAYVPRVAAMTTVSHGIAEQYESDTGVRPAVVPNATRYQDLSPTRVHDPIRLVHWGIADPRRRIEIMIEAMRHLGDRFALDLVLVREGPYLRDLRRAAEGDPRIRFLPPVPMPDLPRFGNDYDIGVFVLPPTHVNQRFVLPNKFFEYVQARLAVAIGPSPEMATLAKKHGFGVHADDFTPEALARALMDLDDDEIQTRKLRADEAARALSAEHAQATMRDVVDRALEQGAPGQDAFTAPSRIRG